MRRPKGEAAELILRALSEIAPRGMTYRELCERTSLPIATLQDNVTGLQKRGKVQTERDGHGFVWVMLCRGE